MFRFAVLAFTTASFSCQTLPVTGLFCPELTLPLADETYDELLEDEECYNKLQSDMHLKLAGIFEKAPHFVATGFGYPVGIPAAKRYYVAQKFRRKNKNFGNSFHLGEDWNKKTGGNTDLGDPVFAVAAGYVAYAGDAGEGWGNVVMLVHKLHFNSDQYVVTLYGHLKKITVKAGTFVHRTNLIGTIGNAGGLYTAHLHFEMRASALLPMGGGYGTHTKGFLGPTGFIKKYRRSYPLLKKKPASKLKTGS